MVRYGVKGPPTPSFPSGVWWCESKAEAKEKLLQARQTAPLAKFSIIVEPVGEPSLAWTR
jgi:hypothetical protein